MSLQQIFPGTSEMAGRMRDFDWSANAFGDPRQWPAILRALIRIVLASQFPIVVWWGPELRGLYNDAYIPFLGSARHPRCLALPGRECWRELWPVIGPMLDGVLATGTSAGPEEFLFFLDRDLPREEVFVHFTYDPVFSEHGAAVAGVFTACTEITAQVVGARRLETLRKLGVRGGDARTVQAAAQHAEAVMAQNPHDVPFSAVYLLDQAGAHAERMAVSSGVASVFPATVALTEGAASPWPLAQVLRTGRAAEIDLCQLGLRLTGGAWPEPATRALVLPIVGPSNQSVIGLLVAGISPRRMLDEGYLTFLEMTAGHIGVSITDARAHEEERARAEAQAELDRARINAAPLADGGLLLNARDITARKLAEGALQAAQASLAIELKSMSRLHALSTRLLAATDVPDTLHEVLNAAIELLRADFGGIQLYNHDAGTFEVASHAALDQDILRRFLQAAPGSPCEQALRSDRRCIIEDVRAAPAAAPVREIAAAAGIRALQFTPMTSSEGRPLGMLFTGWREPHRPSEHDLRILDLYAYQAIGLVERIRAEDALRGGGQRSGMILGCTTDALAEAALKEANRNKDEFLSILGHELRDPLSAISNAVSLLSHAVDRDATERLTGIIKRQLGHIVRLVDDLLEVSRISLGKIEMRKAPTELAAVLCGAVEMCKSAIEESGQHLTVSLPGQPLVLDADAVRLAQVFGNLLSNACRYSQRGGQIWLSVAAEGRQAVVSVRDNGVGIAPDMLQRVFEMFTQAHRELGRGQGGLGIGLALVRTIVGMHGGSVEARSDGPGKGSEFIVRLPLAPGAGQALSL